MASSGIPANLDVKSTLNDVYHQAMISTRGDKQKAQAIAQKAQPAVQRLAELAPKVKAGDAGALEEARGLLEQSGLGEEIIYPWLQAHVDVSTIRKAGIDPKEVERRFEAFQDNQKKGDADAPEGDTVRAGEMGQPRRV